MAKSAARFAHPSEAELAALLNFFNVAWRYEPQSFPISWSVDGDAVEWFTPDFYLPDYDLFIELTTVAPRFQTRKNRKLRMFTASYPEIRIKMLTKRDVERILWKLRRAA